MDIKFEKGFRLRFDLSPNEKNLCEIIHAKGFHDKIESFLHYEVNLELATEPQSQVRKASLLDATPVKEALENLHPVTVDEISKWIESQNIYIYEFENRAVAAAQVYEHGDSAEINRLATHKDFLKKGFALGLLTAIHFDLKCKGFKRVHLKVDESKKPARKLYKKLGYQRLPSKDQIWLSKIF